MIFSQLIDRFERLHDKGIVHCDIKPENILMGLNKESHVVYLVDFGISNFWFDKNGEHIPLQTNCCLIGTVRYVSVNSHLGYELTRRDDLIGLGYMVFQMLQGSLPWEDDVNAYSDKCRVVRDKKLKFHTSKPFRQSPAEI